MCNINQILQLDNKKLVRVVHLKSQNLGKTTTEVEHRMKRTRDIVSK